jgi:pyruvate/2-oxoacid:ferredoxin oxidoreductase alpha subunit
METQINEKPFNWFEYKPENVILSPEPPPVITPQDNKQLIDEQQQTITDLRDFTTKQNDVIKQLIDKQETLEKTIVDQNNLLQEIINRLKK